MTAEDLPPTEILSEKARELVTTLALLPHPEGGYYRELFRAGAIVLRTAAPGSSGDLRRSAVTLIYFLVAGPRPTSWHRVTSTEIWHHAGGAPLWLDIEEDASGARSVLLGDPGALSGPAIGIVPAGAWQRARSTGEFSLTTCTVAPGFEFDDFHLRPA